MFLWFSYGFPMILQLSYGFPMVFLRFYCNSHYQRVNPGDTSKVAATHACLRKGCEVISIGTGDFLKKGEDLGMGQNPGT